MPGWESAFSIGYHGDDGRLYQEANQGAPFEGSEEGENTWGEGDVVGGCINLEQQTLYFTKNGKVVGKVETALLLCAVY